VIFRDDHPPSLIIVASTPNHRESPAEVGARNGSPEPRKHRERETDQMDPYTLTWSPSTKTVEAAFHGVWTLTDAQRWRRDADALLRRIGPGFRMVVDMSDHPPQSQEVKQVHDASIGETVSHGAAKIICITGSAVLAMQMKRSVAANNAGGLFEFVATKEDAARAVAA
jgi:hypothetical protein